MEGKIFEELTNNFLGRGKSIDLVRICRKKFENGKMTMIVRNIYTTELNDEMNLDC